MGMGVAVSGVRLAVLASCALLAACQGPVRIPDTAVDARLERVARIGATLAPAGAAIHPGLSARRGLAAFAWPDGSVLVTRDLVDLLDDEQLAAAIAHEIGHLLDDGHLAAPAALADAPADDEPERRADRTGCRLLAEAGRSPDAMPRMLVAVNAALGTDVLRERIVAATDACKP